MNKQLKNLTNALLSTGLFSAEFTKAVSVARALSDSIGQQKSVRLVYGETYDQYGMTVDSLKYYLMVSLVHRGLEKAGYDVTSDIIVGDIASVKNKNVASKDRLLDAADERIEAIKKITDIYHLPIVTKKMGDLFVNPDFQKTLEATRQIITGSDAAEALLRQTILQNRVKQEKVTGYAYAVEEVALILGYDIKIGPPRERFYDQLAAIVAQQANLKAPVGLYVSPTYPLGMGFDYFICNPEIERYGLTPYKAGSNKLMSHRLILDEIKTADVASLVNDSFVPKLAGLANPVLDLLDTALLAKHFLAATPFERPSLDETRLKQEAIAAVREYIERPLYG